MALDLRNLSPDGRASGVRHWTYTTPDALADINTAGYFNNASAVLQVNDIIQAATSTGTTPVLATYYVNANASGVVDVTDGVVITATDSD